MIWSLYNLLWAPAFLALAPKYLWRMRRRGGYRDGFAERFGFYAPEVRARLADDPRPLWIHAVSVGEMYVALRFIREYRARDPACRFVLSTVTSTGRALALREADMADTVIYSPLDFPWFVARALRFMRPRALLLTEGELWPNLLRLTRAAGAPVAVINGRLSDRSFRGYRRVRFLARRMLAFLSGLYVQSEADRRRYAELGADPARIEMLGSAKYDGVRADPAAAARARTLFLEAGWGPEKRILLGGSTWPGEEQALAEVYKRLRGEFPDLGLVLVPRHAERGGEVLAALQRLGLRVWRRTAGRTEPAGGPPDVFLADTTGELQMFYAAAEVIFVGKSLGENRGGQNIVEPAAHGKPVVTGPHLENFPAIEEDFREAGAFLRAADAAELGDAVLRLLRDAPSRDALGVRAAELVRRRRGVTAATVSRVRVLVGDSP